MLSEASSYIGHFQIRNRGTIGGSIAHADPAAEYPAAALALDAQLEVASSRGRRRVAIEDFLKSAYVTTIEPDELLVSLRVPVSTRRSGFAIEEIARRPGDFALIGAIAIVALGDDDHIADARVVHVRRRGSSGSPDRPRGGGAWAARSPQHDSRRSAARSLPH